MTINGVVVEQIEVNPTMSLNNIVTLSWVLASIDSPETSPFFFKKKTIKLNQAEFNFGSFPQASKEFCFFFFSYEQSSPLVLFFWRFFEFRSPKEM